LRWEESRAAGKSVSLDVLCRASPELRQELQKRIVKLQSLEELLGSARSLDESTTSTLGKNRRTMLTVKSTPAPGYELVELIGKGAYGEVWRAKGPSGLCALKVIS
jgi:hypothetical protein